MKLEDAETLPDGGTTCLTMLDGSEKLYITIDYSLPMDGRSRFVYIGKTQFARDNQLEINSKREKQIVNWLKSNIHTHRFKQRTYGINIPSVYSCHDYRNLDICSVF